MNTPAGLLEGTAPQTNREFSGSGLVSNATELSSAALQINTTFFATKTFLYAIDLPPEN
ncbi:MAG: hypothetical protein JNK16_00145 [Phycisphaerales bacterium]|nr:hypothetical protein [Phycisphaerales bacterium]